MTSASIPGTWNTNNTGPVEVSVTVRLTNGTGNDAETDSINNIFTMTLGPNA